MISDRTDLEEGKYKIIYSLADLIHNHDEPFIEIYFDSTGNPTEVRCGRIYGLENPSYF